MDSATGGSGTSDRAYYLVEYILVLYQVQDKIVKKTISAWKSSFFDILTNTISCGWCKLVDSSLILFIKPCKFFCRSSV